MMLKNCGEENHWDTVMVAYLKLQGSSDEMEINPEQGWPPRK